MRPLYIEPVENVASVPPVKFTLILSITYPVSTKFISFANFVYGLARGQIINVRVSKRVSC